MKKINYITIEVVITAMLIVFLAVLTTPISKSMPMYTFYIFGAIGIAWLIIFILFFLKDPSSDERDQTHIKFASRIAFILGIALLMVATFVQSLNNQLDIMLPIILAVMMLSKTLSILYKRFTD